MNETLENIQDLTFFDELSDSELDLLISFSKITTHAKNSILYYENETQNRLYFLIKGLIKLYKIDKYNNDVFLYYIEANSLISEISCLSDESLITLSNTECMEECIILDVDFKLFKEHFLQTNRLLREFTTELIKRNKSLNNLIIRELVFDATAKVAHLLHNNLEIFNSLKRHEISFMLHIQPETLSRVLNKLRRSYIIEIDGVKASILDEQKLQLIYKGEYNV
ncbi:MAG: Crp/Fnr family transcriptional regulator [Sulfuricurvum sp.]|jgi:CRP/FNR family transcriptional regulator